VKRRKRRSLLQVPTASMGDIAFLLIIFFMLCSRFATQSTDVTPPKSQDLTDLKEPKISVTLTRYGIIYFQGQVVPDAADLENKVRAIVGERKEADHRTVNFRCDAKVTRDVFEPVIEAIAKGGGLIAAMGDEGTEGVEAEKASAVMFKAMR
jgi:biopolymer transport protein ExbD